MCTTPNFHLSLSLSDFCTVISLPRAGSIPRGAILRSPCAGNDRDPSSAGTIWSFFLFDQAFVFAAQRLPMSLGIKYEIRDGLPVITQVLLCCYSPGPLVLMHVSPWPLSADSTTPYHATCLQIDIGGPADKAGLTVGDKILEVDGLTTQGGQVMEI